MQLVRMEEYIKKGYGFSPTVSSPIFTGHAVANEQDLYTNPAYKRTIEISKEQYDKLKAFGEASLSTNHAKKISELTNGKFNTMIYNAGSNSCVDYVYHALRYSGVYDHKVTIIERTNELNEYGEIIHKPIRESDDGRLNVLNNATIFDKIPVAPQYKQKNNDIYKIEDNKYYNSIEEVKKKVPFYLKVENNFINNDAGRIQNASNKNFDLLQETNNLLARLKSGDQTALSDFMGRDDVRQIQRESAMTAQRTEREFEEEARQREMERMAQSHSRGMSIG